MCIEGVSVLVVVLDGIVSGDVVGAVGRCDAVAIAVEKIVLDEDGIAGAEGYRSVPAFDGTVDRHAVSQIDVPIVDELIAVDDSCLLAPIGTGTGVALKFDSGAQELREAGVENLKIRRRSLDVQAPIGDGGDGRCSI